MEPFFSVIIPTYNRAHLIGRTVTTILKQPFPEFEVIVVDDGSLDNTSEVIQNIKDRRLYYVRTSNGERGRARNIGASLAKGKYINFFDSDDVFLLQFSKLYSFIIENNFPPVIYGRLEIKNLEKGHISSPNKPYDDFTKNLLFDNFLACGSVFSKRKIIQKYPFNEERKLSSAEDWELWLRIHTEYKFIKFDEVFFRIVEHSQRSLASLTAKKIEQRDVFFAKLINSSAAIQEKYGKRAINLFSADRYTFIALVYLLEGDKRSGFKFWFKSFVTSIEVTKRRRFWAVLKKFILA